MKNGPPRRDRRHLVAGRRQDVVVLPTVIAIGTPIDGIAEYHYLQFGGQRWGLYRPEPDANPYRAIRLHGMAVNLNYHNAFPIRPQGNNEREQHNRQTACSELQGT